MCPIGAIVIDDILVVLLVVVVAYSGADITATNTDLYTPLMFAASAGHLEAFTELMKVGAAIDAVDRERRTVVHLAAKENHGRILQVII